MSRRKSLASAFTLVELLVVVSIIVLLLSILTPTLFRAKELAKRTQCRGNLGVLGRGMSQYSGDYGQEFACDSPCISGYSNIGGAGSQTASGDPITQSSWAGAKVGAGSAGVSRALYLLVLYKYASTAAFVCPSADGHEADKLPPSTVTWFDFTDYKKLSYSYMVRKNTAVTPPRAKYPLWMGSNPAIVYLADRSPISGIDGWNGTSADPTKTGQCGYDEYGGNDPTKPADLSHPGNTFNHKEEGQNVVSVDASIKWATTPYCGVIDTGQSPNIADNIWTPVFGSKTCNAFPGGADSLPDDFTGPGLKNNEGNDSFLWP